MIVSASLLALVAAASAANPLGSGWIPPNESVSWIAPADAAVSLTLINDGLTFEEPPSAWDGAHLALRFQDECRSYFVSLNRRDGLAVIKKKAPDGGAACGSYYNLGDYATYPVPYGRAQRFRAVIRDRPDGAVEIKLYAGRRLLTTGLDDGVGGPPIREPGEIVLRSDNAELHYESFAVEPAPRETAPKPLVSKPAAP